MTKHETFDEGYDAYWEGAGCRRQSARRGEGARRARNSGKTAGGKPGSTITTRPIGSTVSGVPSIPEGPWDNKCRLSLRRKHQLLSRSERANETLATYSRAEPHTA